MSNGNGPLIQKEYRAMVRAAQDAGWSLTSSRNGHAKLTAPDGSYATPIPGTGKSSTRLVKAIRLRLRRHGVDV